MKTRVVFAVVGLVVLALAGCGGEGGSEAKEPAGDDAPGRTGDADGPRADMLEGVDPEDGAAPGDGAGGETADGSAQEKSWYRLTLDLEQGPAITCTADKQVDCFEDLKCCRLLFDRDLTGLTTKFSFGSTHIAPAIAFAMADTIAVPFSVITLNFGIIIGTADKPPATPKSDVYPFSGFEPEVKVDIYNKTYSSKVEGSEGQVDVTDWSADEGGLFAGTFAGRIVQDTDKTVKLRARVEGEYHFTLPAPQGGQPH